ncbi:MAG: hypothetical protein M3O34_19370 [Chloroflexota bacterium]|nr:hypothetical protein [Chloroflexota bacterium]
MIAGDTLHHPSDALPADKPAVIGRGTGDESSDPEGSGARSRLTSELACALGGGLVLLALALLLYALATWLGLGTADATARAMTGPAGAAAHAEQFAGVFLAGALGTFVAREFAVRPR